ncbi:MAG: glycosyltransferase family 2 protein [Gemmatimonadetes bacterium]|nr:glycosyltransferase family 2 protein [Gemmatimonadota bacterium]
MSTGDARPSRDFSVIVPAHQAALLLPDTLDALSRSSLPRVRWELLVVDDASTDDTARVAARWADAVITLDGPPRGPGGARNAAAARASGTWLVFIDADVRVHPDTLERIATVVTEDPALVGVFGSYDDAPAEQGLLSEYRNLLHRYVHLRGAGDAETFWAGCGAIRRDAFEAVDGFDTARFPRPQIEDIELGYRLRDRGWRIRLDPSIQGTHLKRWRLWPMVRTDFRDRGLPWMRLLLERRGRTAPTLNTGRAEQLRVGLAGLAIATLTAGLLLRSPTIAVASLALWLLLAVANIETYRWFAAERGVGFALRVIPLHVAYYASNALAAAVGIVTYAVTPRATAGGRVAPETRGAAAGAEGRIAR